MELFERIVTIDFETEAIDGPLPPKPVGVAIKYGSGRSKYYSWGHPEGNNSTFEEAQRLLRDAVLSPCLYHNAQFDIAVGLSHMKVAFPAELHDTLLLLFLYNPHAQTLALKPASEKLLDMPPEEQDLIKEWILLNVPEAKPSTAGAYISRVPAKYVAIYACGDVDRTYELFKLLYPKCRGAAYDRERQLTPILVNNTLEGISIDATKLVHDYTFYLANHTEVAGRIYKKLGSTFNISSGEELAAAIVKSDVAVSWIYTATGKRSTSKVNLASAIKDSELLALLAYHSTLSTYLESFFTSWVNKTNDGILHFSWNQVRNNEASKSAVGTRTGRLSSQPSMLNVPKTPPKFDPLYKLPPLPKMRSYLLPDFGDNWISSDYQAQEVRLLAHYEDGALMQAYREDPQLDVHQLIASMLSSLLGKEVSRRNAKTIVFSLLYGQGLAATAEALGCSVEEAQATRAGFYKVVPGIRAVQASIKYSTDRGLPIKTFGKREYFKEPSKEIKDKRTGMLRYADFGYKMLNYLIQGSAADMTKQALINYNTIKRDGRMLLSVHDQICISGPPAEAKILREAMCDIKLDVPVVVDLSMGPNFADLEDIEWNT